MRKRWMLWMWNFLNENQLELYDKGPKGRVIRLSLWLIKHKNKHSHCYVFAIASLSLPYSLCLFLLFYFLLLLFYNCFCFLFLSKDSPTQFMLKGRQHKNRMTEWITIFSNVSELKYSCGALPQVKIATFVNWFLWWWKGI